MPGYPIGCGDYVELHGLGPNGCPISPDGVLEYLNDCEARYPLDVERLGFETPSLTLQCEVLGRSAWVWRCADTRGREWMVVVGDGRPGGRSALHPPPWLLAETADGRTPEAFLNDVIEGVD